MVFLPQELIIGCAISDAWAGKQCKRVVEAAGGRMVVVQPEKLDLPITLRQLSACIYDLAPWDASVLTRIHRLRNARPEMPILFYLPPSPDAVAMAPDCSQLANVRLSMQLRRCEDVQRLERDARWLLHSVPVQQILDTLIEAVPTSPILRLFCREVLRRLSVGMRCTVEDVGHDIGLSSRTVQRHLTPGRLGTPKQVIDRLTVWYLLHLSVLGGLSLSRAARMTGMTPNDFYRLKKRVLISIKRSPCGQVWERMIHNHVPEPSTCPRASLTRPVQLAVSERARTKRVEKQAQRV